MSSQKGRLCPAKARKRHRESENMTKRIWEPWLVESWRRAADQGDARAQYRLGVMYEYGQDIPPDEAEAAKFYLPAAEQGDADAQVQLARMYEKGRGVEKNLTEAVKWYSRNAEQGNVGSCIHLAHMYEEGRGVDQDYVEAARWYREAAERGDAYAQFRLGKMYQNGQGLDQNYGDAARWYREAADQFYAAAQFRLGVCYETGQGVPKDYVLAHAYFNSAAAANYDELFGNPYFRSETEGIAAQKRDCIAEKMTPDQISQAQQLAREIQERLRIADKKRHEEAQWAAQMIDVLESALEINKLTLSAAKKLGKK